MYAVLAAWGLAARLAPGAGEIPLRLALSLVFTFALAWLALAHFGEPLARAEIREAVLGEAALVEAVEDDDQVARQGPRSGRRVGVAGWNASTNDSIGVSVISLGGGARNPQWRAIRQRLLGVPVLNRPEASAARGMARLALSAIASP